MITCSCSAGLCHFLCGSFWTRHSMIHWNKIVCCSSTNPNPNSTTKLSSPNLRLTYHCHRLPKSLGDRYSVLLDHISGTTSLSTYVIVNLLSWSCWKFQGLFGGWDLDAWWLPLLECIANVITEFTRDLRIVFLRSNRISNRIGRPIRFRIEFSNRIGRIYHASRNTV